jgi:hypothetical protein
MTENSMKRLENPTASECYLMIDVVLPGVLVIGDPIGQHVVFPQVEWLLCWIKLDLMRGHFRVVGGLRLGV